MGTWTLWLLCLVLGSSWANQEDVLDNPNSLVHNLNPENLARLEEHQEKENSRWWWSKPSPDYSTIFYKLYTPEGGFDNPTQFSNGASANDLQQMNFNPNRPTKILAHGLNKDYRKMEDLAKGYLSNSDLSDVNVISIDWSKLAVLPLFFNFAVPAKNSIEVGKRVGNYLGKLLITDLGANPNNIHGIGHSLGAHLMGHMGRNIGANVKIGRVTGLDPAKPWFDKKANEAKRISKNDADVVDIIHTDGGGYGFDISLGTVDFYPSGGQLQPGCNWISDKISYCSHARAIAYYVESLAQENNGNSKFESRFCSSYDEFTKGSCSNKPCTPVNGCLHMGERLEQVTSGANNKYFLDNNSAPPYSNS